MYSCFHVTREGCTSPKSITGAEEEMPHTSSNSVLEPGLYMSVGDPSWDASTAPWQCPGRTSESRAGTHRLKRRRTYIILGRVRPFPRGRDQWVFVPYPSRYTTPIR